MSAHFKKYSEVHIEGEWRNGPLVVCEAKFLINPSGWIVDQIETPVEHRGQGYAKALLSVVVENTGVPVKPFAVRPESVAFWEKMEAAGIAKSSI